MIIKPSKIKLPEIDNHLIRKTSDLTPSKDDLSDLLKQKINEAIYSLDNHKGISHDLVIEETKNRYSKCFK